MSAVCDGVTVTKYSATAVTSEWARISWNSSDKRWEVIGYGARAEGAYHNQRGIPSPFCPAFVRCWNHGDLPPDEARRYAAAIVKIANLSESLTGPTGEDEK
jgi:hypothetical protein